MNIHICRYKYNIRLIDELHPRFTVTVHGGDISEVEPLLKKLYQKSKRVGFYPFEDPHFVKSMFLKQIDDNKYEINWFEDISDIFQFVDWMKYTSNYEQFIDNEIDIIRYYLLEKFMDKIFNDTQNRKWICFTYHFFNQKLPIDNKYKLAYNYLISMFSNDQQIQSFTNEMDIVESIIRDQIIKPISKDNFNFLKKYDENFDRCLLYVF